MTALLILGLVAWFVALFVAGLIIATPRDTEHESTYERVRAALRRRPPNPSRSLHSLADHATAIAERSLERRGKRGNLEATLERAGLNMRPGEFVVLAVSAAAAAFVVGALFGGLVVAVIAAVVVVAGTRFMLSHRAEKRAAKFDAQLEQTLPLMAGSLRAGFGLMQALDVVARDMESPTSDEFRRLVMESRLGRDLGDSLEALAARVRSEDFEFVVQAIEIHREVGGDLAEVLDKVSATIRDRNRVRRQVRTLSAEGRFSAGVLFFLPIAMFFAISVLNPSYFHELSGTTVGKVMIGFALLLMATGGLWMRRLVRLVF